MNHTIDSLKQKLAQLKQLNASGILDDAKFEQGKAALERQILELVLGAAPLAAGKAAVTPAKPPVLLLAGLTVAIVVIAAAGYLWKGIPAQQQGEAEQPQMTSADGKAAPHSTNAEQIVAMTEKLAERLKDKPDDVEGWSMLARSYSVLGRHADALKAYEKALSLRKDDATLMADYADSLAVNNDSNLEGEPMKLVERALKIDPKNLKALYLAGTYDFNKKDYKGAVKRRKARACPWPFCANRSRICPSVSISMTAWPCRPPRRYPARAR